MLGHRHRDRLPNVPHHDRRPAGEHELVQGRSPAVPRPRADQRGRVDGPELRWRRIDDHVGEEERSRLLPSRARGWAVASPSGRRRARGSGRPAPRSSSCRRQTPARPRASGSRQRSGDVDPQVAVGARTLDVDPPTSRLRERHDAAPGLAGVIPGEPRHARANIRRVRDPIAGPTSVTRRARLPPSRQYVVIGVSAVSASTPAKSAKSEPAPRIFPCASRPCATAWIGERLSQLRAPGYRGRRRWRRRCPPVRDPSRGRRSARRHRRPAPGSPGSRPHSATGRWRLRASVFYRLTGSCIDRGPRRQEHPMSVPPAEGNDVDCPDVVRGRAHRDGDRPGSPAGADGARAGDVPRAAPAVGELWRRTPRARCSSASR